MGRYYFDSKSTIESCRGLSMPFLKKHGHLCGWSSGGCTWSNRGVKTGNIGFTVDTKNLYIRFVYTVTDRQTGVQQDKNYTVTLTTTPCHLGGIRYWFVCTFCKRRVSALYICDANDFACRHCLGLTYESRNMTKRFRDYQKFFDLEKVHEKISCLKRRHYRKKPTRRYASLVRKMERLSTFDISSLIRGDLL